jgi:Holliday junction resolvase-like predicted endonuclease
VEYRVLCKFPHIFVGVAMIIERDLLMSLLKLTKAGHVLIKDINKDSRIVSDIIKKLLKNLQNEGLIYLKDDAVETNSDNRLRLAVKAVALGADFEHVSAFFSWQEFEGIAALALVRNGYFVAKNVRFKHAGRRWEIDVVGCRKPLVVCVDCKHWRRGLKPSALGKIVEAQVERVHALADALPILELKIECIKWSKAKFIPVILSLFPSSSKFYENVPVVPALQLQDFLFQLPAEVDSLKYLVKGFSHL